MVLRCSAPRRSVCYIFRPAQDPNKQVVRVYSVPANTFESDDEDDTDDDEQDQEQDQYDQDKN